MPKPPYRARSYYVSSQPGQRTLAQAARQRQQAYLQLLETQASSLSQGAEQRYTALTELLPRGLTSGMRFDWSAQKTSSAFPPFSYPAPAPTYASVAAALHVPRKSFLESMIPAMRVKRERMEAQAQQELVAQSAAYQANTGSALRDYEQKRLAFEQQQNRQNASIDDLKRRYEQGEAAAVSWVVGQVLDRLDLPEGYGKQYEVSFNLAQGTVVISMWLPKPTALPRIVGYKLVKVRKAVEPIELKQREYDALYDNVVHQIALLTIHRIFRDCQAPIIRSVVFNGIVTRVNPAIGKDEDACVLSVRADRNALQTIDLRRVDARECIKNLGGATSGALARLTPVRPLMDIKNAGGGQQAQQQAQPNQYCSHCGALNRNNATYCAACGHNVATGAAGPVPTPHPLAKHIPAGGTQTGLLTANNVLHRRFRIIQQVGKGGMGAVYKAADSQLGDRAVAVKEMSQSGLNPSEVADAAENFKAEAVMLARLSHPSLPKVFDHFAEGNRWYLVMDFIAGETLEALLSTAKNHQLPVKEVLAIGVELCAVLDYLHSQQPPVIFRDLKPSNVMVTSVGAGQVDVHLIDFGIARLFKADKVADTVAFGSPGYAAPEQYGKAQTTGKSDIYSLGATLHHLLTGIDPATIHFTSCPCARSTRRCRSTLNG